MGNLQDLEVEDYLKDCVVMDPLFIQEEYVRLPADLAYWNQKYADALRAHLRAKIDLDRIEAQVYLEKREVGYASGGKTTEATVAAQVACDARVLAAREVAVMAEAEKARLHGVVNAVSAKKDMLVSLGAHVRQEMDGDPTIREQHAGFRKQQNSKR